MHRVQWMPGTRSVTVAENARAMDDLNAILASREPLYAKADLTLDTAGKTAAQSARDLAALLTSPRLRGEVA